MPVERGDQGRARDPSRWPAYNSRQHARTVRPLLLRAMTLVGQGHGRQAIDLGCGAGVEALTMLEAGWSVRALDLDVGSLAALRVRAGARLRPALRTQEADLDDLPRLPRASLVHASYALPYARPARFTSMWATVLDSLQPGGWLAVDLFGDRDSWADAGEETYLTEAAARALFADLEVVVFDVEDEDGAAFSGPKHWHVFHVIARRPPR